MRNPHRTLVLCLSAASSVALSNACDDARTVNPGAPMAGTSGASTTDTGGTSSGGRGGAGGGTLGAAASAAVGGEGGAAAGGSASSPVVPPVGSARPNCDAPGASSLPPLQLTQIASGLVNPLYLSRVPGDDSRLLVVEQGGTVRVIRNGELLPAPLLDISASLHESGEMGLLGLALHPDYRENGRFFVMYSTNPANELGDPHDAVLAEYRTSPADPDRVDESIPERRLLTVLEPEGNHNGGAIEFGPDGFLYVALGDGGGGGDEHGAIGNGQALDTLLGKILRIDVDASDAGQYGIPAGNLADDNPAALPEIWSYGLRNPWRFSFDACTGDMYIADVGQDAFEEVNVEPAGTAGRNYGWRLMEAEACFNPATGCAADAQNLVLPVASYPHEGPGISGFSITGGYVYRGSAIPNLRGTYLYADFISNVILALRMSGGELTLPQTSLSDNFNPGQGVQLISSFGQDNAGEVYVVSFGGSIYRIDPRAETRARLTLTSPAVLAEPDCGPAPDDVGCDIFPFENTGLGESPNLSPELNWTGAPPETQSVAIALRDLSFEITPGNPFTHWILWNVPGTTSGLAAALPGGATPGPPAPAGSQQASILGNRYAGSGACGNVYEFVIYALGVGAFSPQNPDDPDAVEDEIARSAAVLATGSLRARSAEPNCRE